MNFEKREDGRIRFLDTDGIDHNTWTKLLRLINHLGYDLHDENDLKRYFDRHTFLNDDQSHEVLKVFGQAHDEEKYSSEMIKRDTNKAKKIFGTTGSYFLAGYLLTDGEMLRFSYTGHQRDVDHREISEAMEIETDGYSDALIQFENYGHIRMQLNGFELSRKPTTRQKSVLLDFMRYLKRKDENELYVDIANLEGHVVKSFSYDFPMPHEVLSDIDEYFESIAT